MLSASPVFMVNMKVSRAPRGLIICLMGTTTFEGPGEEPLSFDVVGEHGSHHMNFPGHVCLCESLAWLPLPSSLPPIWPPPPSLGISNRPLLDGYSLTFLTVFLILQSAALLTP